VFETVCLVDPCCVAEIWFLLGKYLKTQKLIQVASVYKAELEIPSAQVRLWN